MGKRTDSETWKIQRVFREISKRIEFRKFEKNKGMGALLIGLMVGLDAVESLKNQITL